MEKIKGIVMRTSPKVTVIYTKEGNFLEVKTPIDPPVTCIPENLYLVNLCNPYEY